MKLKMIAVVAALASAALAGPAWAAWTMVGQKEVNDRAETDIVHMDGHRIADRMRVCVYRNPVHFIDMDIYFRNGGHQDVPLRYRVNAGDCTRVIDLTGGQRDIQHIVFRYEETSRRRARATVRVFVD
jgi:hypothetical protein